MSNAYSLYAVSNGALNLTPDPASPVLGYNSTLDQWEVVSPQPSVYSGYYALTHQLPTNDLGAMPEGPLPMGSYQLVPGSLEARTSSVDPYRWTMANWAHNPTTQEVVSPVLAIDEDSLTYFPTLLTVHADPANPGQYYVAGSESQIGHWDGTSAGWVNMGNPGDYVATLDWRNFVASSLSSPTGPGDMVRHYPMTNTDPVYGIGAGYIFYQAGYFWILPILPVTANGPWAGGGATQVTTNVVYRTSASGAGLMDNTVIGTGSLQKIFLQFDPATQIADATTGQINLAPVYWSDLVFISIRRNGYNASGWSAPENPSVSLVDPSGGIHSSLYPTWSFFGGETDAVGLGAYKHPESGNLYGFFVSSSTILSGTHGSSASAGTLKLHVMQLTGLNRTTWSSTWTEVGSHTVTSAWLNSVASISSDANNLFIEWLLPTGSFYGGITRFDLGAHTFTDWAVPSSYGWFDAPLFMRPAAAPAITRRSYVTQI